MKSGDLRALAARLSAADAVSEQSLLNEILRVLRPVGSAEKRAHWQGLLHAGAVNDVAIAIFRAALGGYGFQMGALPAGRAVAQIWSDGDANASVYTASTPALALLQAAASAIAKRIEEDVMAQCPSCRGLGWYITARNTKAICQHTNEMA